MGSRNGGGRQDSGCALETCGGGAGGVTPLVWILGSQEYFFQGAGDELCPISIVTGVQQKEPTTHTEHKVLARGRHF